MKKTAVLVTIIFVVGVLFFLSNQSLLKQVPASTLPVVKEQFAASATPVPTLVSPVKVGTPITLRISAIGVDAPIERVGQDKKGAMDVPKNVDGVGWYELGTKPGELGSAVMDGHLDKVTGERAVFYKLASLKVGEEIIVEDEFDKEYRFKVVENRTYPYDKLPLVKIFTTSDRPRLNLITCGGEWDVANKNYSNRQVVYAVME
jgi:hypothetical protein